ncbi:MAG: VOC family protein [Anaerolineaceae bacterium]|nr:VOC family protein [Anaerolineaceae bacterium]
MSDSEKAKLGNLCPVFLSNDIRRTVQFYVDKLGFWSAQHYDKVENFATIYRDDIEFVIVAAKQGVVESNLKRYGAGFDAYIDPAEIEGVEQLYAEYRDKGVKILQVPHLTAYGSIEFVFEDIDGRQIGVGRIKEKETYFKNTDGKPA